MGETSYKHAFTLAEVLITLSIIGVVAALTIPSLIINNQEKQAVVQLKKAYNVLSNAFTLAEIEYGSVDSWGWSENGGIDGAILAINKILPFMNTLNYCPNEGCYPKGTIYKWGNGTNYGDFSTLADAPKVVLSDGMIFHIWNDGKNCTNKYGNSSALKNVCGSLVIDVNGSKKPNTLSKDTFSFWITKDGVIPMGTPDDTKRPLKSQCVTNYGWGCTAWVLIKENMDYPSNGNGWD